VRPETARIPQIVARQTTLIILILFSCIILLKFIHKISDPRYVGGNLVGLGLNYIQFGAVRRGLAGSIVYLSGVNLVAGARLVYWISYILFLSLAYLILKRMTAVARFFVPFVIILAALLLFWSTDIGRTDMLVAAILAGAALAAIDGRIITASVCVGAGFTVHEAVAIYGLPLVFAILLDQDRYKNVRLSSAAIGGAIIVVSFVAGSLIIPLLPHSDPKTIVQTIKSELPSSYLNESTDQSFFFLLTGARGVQMVQCAIQHSVHYFLHPFVAIFMIALTTFSLSGLRHLRWTAPAVASVPPMLLLWLIASDMSRWTAFSILNVWIVCAARGRVPADNGSGWPLARTASAVAVVILLYPSTVSVFPAYGFPSPLIEKAVESILGPAEFRHFDDCDPTWRSVLTGTDDDH
jgi:hypothetical protein